MNPIYQTSSQLKEKARNQMEGKYGITIAMLLIVQLINVMAGLLIGSFFPATSIFTYIIQAILTFLLSALVNICTIGITLFHLNIACGGPFKLEDLWFGFQQNFGKSFVLSLVITAITFVYQEVCGIPLTLYSTTFDMAYLWIGLAVVIIAAVVFMYLSILYSQAFYLMLDYPTYSAKEILKMCPRIMKGHKRRLLYIQLSFLPLVLLGLLTCGIGTFWVTAYQNMTLTNFYLDLMNPQKPTFDQTV